MVFAYGVPRFHLIGAAEALLTLPDRQADIGYYNRIPRYIFNRPFHNLMRFQICTNCPGSGRRSG